MRTLTTLVALAVAGVLVRAAHAAPAPACTGEMLTQVQAAVAKCCGKPKSTFATCVAWTFVDCRNHGMGSCLSPGLPQAVCNPPPPTVTCCIPTMKGTVRCEQKASEQACAKGRGCIGFTASCTDGCVGAGAPAPGDASCSQP
jgi:hypothetical protein